MPNERRSSVEILAEILRLVRNGEKKTRIMYGANLSHEALNKYLNFLREGAFIVHDEKGGRFHITQLGMEFAADLERVTRHLRSPMPP
ncbi:MAG TPA: winged helix-turn-helix domain-containing protein [Candidatus Thermoplasmatota archaeon]|nr:winged helix-turn-helix domain-containing protein [Candidatus Thermoplasmatota archaeon]